MNDYIKNTPKVIRNLFCLLLVVGVSGLDAQQRSWEEIFSYGVHTTAVAGVTSGEEEDLALHGHDPNQSATIQGVELALKIDPADFITGFARFNSFLTVEDDWDAEWEESFVDITELPVGSVLRAGAYYNRLGLQNEAHLHAWDFVDANLSTSQFLGEEGLVTEGAQWSGHWDVQDLGFGLALSYGRAREHSHEEHGHEEEDHEDEDHDEDEDHEEEEHGHEDEHGHSESVESAYWGNGLFVLSADFSYASSDFHEHSWGWHVGAGENGFSRNTYLTSFDYQYVWRENGFEAGGRSVKAQLEYFYRQVEWESEDDADESGQSSLMAALAFEFVEDWTAALRYGWIEGVQDGAELHEGELEYGFETEELQRLSCALTHHFSLSDDWAGHVRVQYNYDDRENLGEEHSVWLQVNLSFGAY